MRAAFVSLLTGLIFVAAWWSGTSSGNAVDPDWQVVTPGVLRSSGTPAGYAIIEGDAALLIGAAPGMKLESLTARGVQRVEACLLTHHHRDSTAQVAAFAKSGITVRAVKSAAEWLSPDGVRQFWSTSLPVVPADRAPVLRDRSLGLFAYLMQPEGFAEVQFDLADGQVIDWRGWSITVVATPGHSRDHVAFYARKSKDTNPTIFCGDAFFASGTMWTPYTLDWDHWNDTGIKAAAESLRKLASLKPAMLCPEHGSPLSGIEEASAALKVTAERLDEAGFLKSYERFTKERLGTPPTYSFLAKDQVATAGEKPWTKLSDNLYLTGNTYVLTSRTGSLLIVDPYGPQIAEQISQLQRSEKLGPVEVILISHAHNDHYTGAFLLPERNRWKVWTLDAVARPISAPFSVCAPYVDTRALEVDRILQDGEEAAWQEYRFRIGHFPGQTLFTMGIQTTIDGRKCYFTADNFFHMDQFSGSGGWSGRNRAWPELYGRSAQQVLDAAPDWVLAEHGGAFVFSAEDFRRRVQWCRETAGTLDRLSPTSQHRHDWNPTRITFEPMLQKVAVDGSISGELVLENPLPRKVTLTIELLDRGLVSPFAKEFEIGPGATLRHTVRLGTRNDLPPGRNVFPFTVRQGPAADPADVFLVVERPVQ